MSLIFDIGFNNGEFTDACNQKFPDYNIVAAEANINLCYKSRRKNYRNLKLINYIVCEKDGEVRTLHMDLNQDGVSTVSEDFMNNSRFAKGSKYLIENNTSWTRTAEVHTVTLDKMIEKYGTPEIIKVDVEGYEYNVLSGLSHKVGKICFECHEEEQEKLNNCIDHLLKLGYNKFGFIGYLDEGDKYKNLTYSEVGDPYLVEPNRYVSWKVLKSELDICFDPQRRVNYGMFWCK
jgi:FkbM family methyltransferase|tara:strand:- start:35092 stop:35793 length:702 start_codon:yes stop_codon:yes gene_type:complete